MIKCSNCNHGLRCTFTIDDPAHDNVVLRRKLCPRCGAVYFSKEEITRVVKVGESIEKLSKEIETC